MKEYARAMKNYANFSGRASRKEFWMFQLFLGLLSIFPVVDQILCLIRMLTTGTRGENRFGPPPA